MCSEHLSREYAMMPASSALLKVSLRQSAVYLPDGQSAADSVSQSSANPPQRGPLKPETALFVFNLKRLGYGLSEALLGAVDEAGVAFQAELVAVLREVMGVDKNWTPLVRGWDIPTGEDRLDHLFTYFANLFGTTGTRLACGHIIPPGTFPLERYTGCPFCGTPFETHTLPLLGQGSKLKVLERWQEPQLTQFLKDLLASTTPLDATQLDSLKLLLQTMPIPPVAIGMKETVVAVVDALVEADRAADAQPLFTSPTDILRYLWYKHTGFIQLVEPRVLIRRKGMLERHLTARLNQEGRGRQDARQMLKLKYSRPEGLQVARWLNGLKTPVEQQAEQMHPKREVWVRFIRALRLGEHARRPAMGQLRALLDVFYHQRYTVVAGQLDQARREGNPASLLTLLQSRPGLFARSLLATMLRFGAEPTLTAFEAVVDRVPLRLIFSLVMFSDATLQRGASRVVRPLAGSPKTIPVNNLVSRYSDAELNAMGEALRALCLRAARAHYLQVHAQAMQRAARDAGSGTAQRPPQTVYVEPLLDYMPVPISDRSTTVQDLPVALMGTRFPLEGTQIRLFMQWGAGLSAQHMDMDLSARVLYDQESIQCYFGNLVTVGCRHSGDIRAIPDQVGTAEYIELDVATLAQAQARYVVFTSNAYSAGALTPNLVVGWMNSAHPMTISSESGVAYDPSCVQHQVRITSGLSKGLVFGVLDVACREIIWLELPFEGQVTHQLNLRTVQGMLKRLNDKLSIGALLRLRAEAQGLTIIETPDADEVYTARWGQNAAQVTRLLL